MGGGVFRASTNLPQSRVFKVLEASEQGDMWTVDARGSTRRHAASDSSAVDSSFSITICLFIMQISGGGVEKGSNGGWMDPGSGLKPPHSPPAEAGGATMKAPSESEGDLCGGRVEDASAPRYSASRRPSLETLVGRVFWNNSN